MKNVSWLKKISFIIGGIVFIFIITNPSPKSFSEFSGDRRNYNQKRIYNWIIFSVYENTNGNKYLGVFMNFFPIEN